MLKWRVLIDNFIELCKITRDIDRVNAHSLFPKVGKSRTRVHSFIMRGEI